MIIGKDIGRCYCCKREFLEVKVHHIDGNPKNNKEENIIKVCKYCYKAIHKSIANPRFYDIKTIKEILKFRILLHKARFGHLKFIPKDSLTEKYKEEIEKEKVYNQIRKNLEKISEIRYS